MIKIVMSNIILFIMISNEFCFVKLDSFTYLKLVRNIYRINLVKLNLKPYKILKCGEFNETAKVLTFYHWCLYSFI